MRISQRILSAAAVGAAVLFYAAGAHARQVPVRINDDDVKNIVVRIERASDTFRKTLDRALDDSRFDGRSAEDNINDFIKRFEESTDRFRSQYKDDKRGTEAATEVLQRALDVDRFMARHDELSPTAHSDWAAVRASLDQLALAYNIRWTWDGTMAVVSRATDSDVKHLLSRIEAQADGFRKSLDEALDRTAFDDTRAEDEINRYVRDFEQSTDRWESRFDDDNTAVAAATDVLERAKLIDAFMDRHALTPRAQADWDALRGTLDQLAHAYNVAWTW
jgi:hypothetical protein